jgi:hypothetical protein|nr:MAG TPA: hypothetical protein [Caudoviricetes sp.]
MLWWQHLLSYIIPLASVGLSYILGRCESRKSYISAVRRERYDNFYAPFIHKLYTGMMWDVRFSSLSTSARGVFLDLIMHNIKFIDEKTMELIPEFYHAMLDNLEQENGTIYHLDNDTTLDEIFRQIAIRILSQAKILSKELHLPDIGAYAAAKFAQ